MTQARFAKELRFVALICLSSVCSSTTGAEGKSAPDVTLRSLDDVIRSSNSFQIARTFCHVQSRQDRSRSLLALQQRFEIRERRMRCTAATGSVSAATASRFQLPLVFIVVAVQA